MSAMNHRRAVVLGRAVLCLAAILPLRGTAAVLDSGDFGTFAAACAAAAKANETLTVSKAWPNLATGRCAADLVFYSGGRLELAPGSTVTLTGTLSAPPIQIFDTSAANAAVLFAASPADVYPNWWGADPTGKTDSAPAFNRAIRALKNAASDKNGTALGSRLLIPSGNFLIGSTILVEGFWGLEFTGVGYQSNLMWNGDKASPMIRFEGVMRAHVHDFLIRVSTSHPALAAVEIMDGAKGDATSHQMSMNDVWIHGDIGSIQDGILIDGQDANNDFHRFENVLVNGFSHAGADIKGSQAYSEYFENCELNPYGGGQYGVIAGGSGGPGSGSGGSFVFDGGGVGSNIADFYLDGTTDYPITIRNIDDESNGMFLLGTNAAYRAVVVDGIRWVKHQQSKDTQTDFIRFQGGSLSISDSSFASYAPATAHKMTLNFSSPAGNMMGVLQISNTVIHTTNETLETLLTGEKPNARSPLLWNTQYETEYPRVRKGFYSNVLANIPSASIGVATIGTMKMVYQKFSSLPQCNPMNDGLVGAVSDSRADTWGAPVTGGGAIHVVALCDGANWTVMGR